MTNILIVDDSPTYQASIQQMLHKHGYHCHSEDNGAAGVAAAIRRKPDLILMDVIMPGMSGFQATRTITRNAETAHIPIIIISTKDQDSDRAWGLRQGARAYLNKPLIEEDIIAVIDSLLCT